jgi:type VI secretion system FHA domain protein
MTLVLTITNVESLENGVPTRLKLDRHGAVIGRSPHADWSLPDPRHYISSTHCEIDYVGGSYLLVDKSTNGAFLNGSSERMGSPHTLKTGDVVLIGHYEIAVQVNGVGPASGASGSSDAGRDWSGWDAHVAPAPGRVDPSAWDRPAAKSAISGEGPMSANWTPSRADHDPDSPWSTPAPATDPASPWSSPVSETSSAPAAHDVWGALAAGSSVDWARGGFGAAAPAADPFGLAPSAAPAADPFGLEPPPPAGRRSPSPAVAPAPSARDPFGDTTAPRSAAASAWGALPSAGAGTAPPTAPASAAPTAPPPLIKPAPAAAPPGAADALLAGAGLDPALLQGAPDQILAAAGRALARMTAGLVVMLEARARAKAQLGAQGTALEFQGNNPLKFARSPDRALAQLLNPTERGFMPAEPAIEDAFRDLQAHQMATLAAMQGALAATLARFSPQAIRERAESRGLLAKIIPAAREAELWKAYEREFEGVAKGSDEAFMDVFAKEFRTAYEKVSAEMKR